MKKNTTSKIPVRSIAWVGAVLLFLASIYLYIAFPETLWIAGLSFGLLIAVLAFLIYEYRNAVHKRTLAYGATSLVTTMLVISILGVINFLAFKNQKKFDLTKTQVNTLSDQTIKVVKGLGSPVKAVLFVSAQERDRYRGLLDNYKTISSQFEVEYVDPVKERSRAVAAGIQRSETLQLILSKKVGDKIVEKDNKIDSPTEEKITNALIKLTRDKISAVCNLSQHGEKSFENSTQMGLTNAKKILVDQSYEIRELNLMNEGKIPTDCAALTILGPSKAFLDQEIKLLGEYLQNGGRVLFALDIDARAGTDPTPQLTSLLQEWSLDVKTALILDPVSRMMQLEPTFPLMASYSKESDISKEMEGNSIFPFARPIMTFKTPPASLKIQWLVQTTPNAWGETQLQALGKGPVKFDSGTDFKGPLYTGYSAEGTREAGKGKSARIVVFGTSLFFVNEFSRLGNNVDLFANSVSWLLEDNDLISIRAKEGDNGKIELSRAAGQIIAVTVVLVLPLLMSILGFAVWIYRKRL